MRDGMVLDFADLKGQVRAVLARYDHRHWNDFLDYPTVENICERLAERRSPRASPSPSRSASTRATRSGRRPSRGAPRDDPGRRGAPARRPARRRIARMWALSAEKILALEKSLEPRGRLARSSPLRGRYTARGWTEWTQGFQFGSALLQFDATGDRSFLELGRERTVRAHGAPRHAHGRARPRLQQRQHLRRPAAARARGPLRAPRAGSATLVRARAQGQRRRAGRGAGRAPPTAAASSTRSTARTRCSPTRCARCARWRSRTASATRCSRRATARCRCSSGSCQHARTTARFNVYYGRGPRRLRRARPRGPREPLQRRGRQLPLPEHAAGLLAVHAPGRAGWPGCCSASPSSSSSSRRVPDAELEPLGGRGGGRAASCSRRRARPPPTTSSTTPADGIPYWDTGAPGLARLPRPPRAAGRPVQRPRAGRQLGRRRSPRRASLRLGRLLERRGEAEDGPPLLPGRA